MKRKPFGILMVTQFPEEAYLFHRLIVLNQGRIAFNDSPNAVFKHVAELHRMGVDIPVHVEMQLFLEAVHVRPD